MKKLFFAIIPFFSILLLISCNKETDLIITPDAEDPAYEGPAYLVSKIEAVIGISWDDVDDPDKTHENLKAIAQIKQSYHRLVSYLLPNGQQVVVSHKLHPKGFSIIEVDWSQEMDNELLLEMVRVCDSQLLKALEILRTSSDIVIPRTLPYCPNLYMMKNYGVINMCPAQEDSPQACTCS